MTHDAREIKIIMADNIEISARHAFAIGAIENGERMMKWAAELREEAENVDADGYLLIQPGHA